MRIITVSSVYVQLLFEGVNAKGLDPKPLLEAHGLNPELLTNARLRAPAAKFGRLAQSTKHFLGDETLGLLARPQKIGTHSWIARSCLNAQTIGDSLQSWSKGLDFSDNAMGSSSHIDDDMGMLSVEFDLRLGVRSDYVIASTFMLVHRFHCWLANDFLPIARMEFSDPEPAHASEYRFLFYGAPVVFNAPQNAIYLERSSLDLPSARSSKDFDDIYGDFHARLMAQPRTGSATSVKVRLWLENQLRKGETKANLDFMAATLQLTPQTLRRRLNSEGTTFKKIKEDVRRDLAIAMLDQGRKSVEAIAFQLGYSEASAFIRAFKKRTGITPLAYKKMHHRPEA